MDAVKLPSAREMGKGRATTVMWTSSARAGTRKRDDGWMARGPTSYLHLGASPPLQTLVLQETKEPSSLQRKFGPGNVCLNTTLQR